MEPEVKVRSMKYGKALLGDFTNCLHRDGYGVYGAPGKNHLDRIQPCGNLSRASRNFVYALPPPAAGLRSHFWPAPHCSSRASCLPALMTVLRTTPSNHVAEVRPPAGE